MGRNRALGTPLEIQLLTSSLTTTEAHIDVYAIDAPMGSPVTLTLDASPFSGDQLLVVDVGLNAAAQHITVQASPGQSILGFGASVPISTNGGSVQLTFSQALDAWIPVFGGGGGGASCGELVALVTDVDSSADALFPGTNTCHNLTVVYQGPTTVLRTLLLPLTPFVGERVTVVSDGDVVSPATVAVNLDGNGHTVSMTGTPAVSPVIALTIPAVGVLNGAPGFSSVTVLWDGVIWVQVAEVPSLTRGGPPPS